MNIISFEGTEGVGKTTICNLLIKKINQQFGNSKKVQYYREPMFLREEIFSNNIENYEYLLLLFLASRKKLLQQLDPHSDLIIIDRYIDSTLIYQILLPYYKKNKQTTIDIKLFLDIQKKIIFENNSEFLPTITFVLEADIEDLKKRKIEKSFDNVDDQIIQNLYKLLPYIYPNRIFHYFNTSRNSPEEITSKIMEVLQKNAL